MRERGHIKSRVKPDQLVVEIRESKAKEGREQGDNSGRCIIQHSIAVVYLALAYKGSRFPLRRR